MKYISIIISNFKEIEISIGKTSKKILEVLNYYA